MFKKKRTWFYSFVYEDSKGQIAFGCDFWETNTYKHYIMCEIQEHLRGRFPKSKIAILNISLME